MSGMYIAYADKLLNFTEQHATGNRQTMGKSTAVKS